MAAKTFDAPGRNSIARTVVERSSTTTVRVAVALYTWMQNQSTVPTFALGVDWVVNLDQLDVTIEAFRHAIGQLEAQAAAMKAEQEHA